MNIRVSHFAVRLSLVLALLSALALGTTRRASAATIIYVNGSAVGANNGTSWANAYKNLQKALTAAVNGDQIWVAKGIYKPGLARTATFMLKTGVTVYGGFAGTETLLRQRNPALNVTILSGEIGAPGIADNAYHVVSGAGADNTAMLNGFTISGGNANGTSPNDSGGGIYDVSSNPTLVNLVITGNHAVTNGGGMFNYNGLPILLKNVTFKGNHSAATAGGLYNDSASPTLVNVNFTNNSADGYAGGMYAQVGILTLTKVAFVGNTATRDGGGLYAVSVTQTLTRVSFKANKALDAGGGMFSSGSTTTLTRVAFIRNVAPNTGGGMVNTYSGTVTLTNVLFSHNTATNGVNGIGGGMYNGSSSLALTNVTFSGNKADYAGGINDFNSSMTLTNATFSGNSANHDGGALYNVSSGLLATNVTVSGNSALGNGGAMFDDASSPLVEDSIFWGDGTEIYNKSGIPDLIDTIVQGGCPGTWLCMNVMIGDPKLGPLQNNGGLTPTRALGAGSAALDTGAANSACATKDQRGVARPQGLSCDVGAYEVKAMTFVSQAAYDGQVIETAPGSNIGGPTNTASSWIFVGDYPQDQQLRGFLSFNTAPVPDTATLIAARLRAEQLAAPTGNPFGTLGVLVADLANPYFGSGPGLLPSDWQAAATVSPAGTFGSVPSGNWYTAGLNSNARSHINRVGLTQFRLRFTLRDSNNQADYVIFNSGDNPSAPDRPVLIVYFNP